MILYCSIELDVLPKAKSALDTVSTAAANIDANYGITAKVDEQLKISQAVSTLPSPPASPFLSLHCASRAVAGLRAPRRTRMRPVQRGSGGKGRRSARAGPLLTFDPGAPSGRQGDQQHRRDQDLADEQGG